MEDVETDSSLKSRSSSGSNRVLVGGEIFPQRNGWRMALPCQRFARILRGCRPGRCRIALLLIVVDLRHLLLADLPRRSRNQHFRTPRYWLEDGWFCKASQGGRHMRSCSEIRGCILMDIPGGAAIEFE